MRKYQNFAYAKTKTQISCAVTAEVISAFVFYTWIVQFLFFLNTKFVVVAQADLYQTSSKRPFLAGWLILR